MSLREPCIPPSLHSFLEEPLWTVYEAVFVLTRWPNKGFIRASISPPPFNMKRYFYLPENKLSLNLKMIGKEYDKVFFEIKTAIEHGELAANFEHLFDSLYYFVKPKDVIVWAILKGYILPNHIQSSLQIYQIKNINNSKPFHSKVTNKIVGQFLLAQNPNLNVTELINHKLMRSFGASSLDKERKAIRVVLNDLFDAKGRKGRPPRIEGGTTNRKYIAKAILEVLQQDAIGVIRYHFPALQTTMRTLTLIKIYEVESEYLLRISSQQFLTEFLEDPVVNLYISNAPDIVIDLVKTFCLERLDEYLRFQSKLQFIKQHVAN